MDSAKPNRNILKTFNKHLVEFITDLVSIFPEDSNLKTMKI